MSPCTLLAGCSVLLCLLNPIFGQTICDTIQAGQWVRDTQDCTVAHQCGFEGEIAQSTHCNTSQVWSNLAHACVWEGDPDRDDCNGNPHVPIADDPRCVKKHGNNVDPDDCSRFISCTNGTLMAFQRCGDGTLYYPKNDSCQFAHAVAHDCGNRRIPDTILIPDEDPMCQDVKDDVVPDPSSCYHFYYCHYGRLGPRHRCPAGTAFSTHSKSCEWSAKTSCGGRMRR
ncbi:uncharacterized protein LOC118763859 [Octopus sinensis]|uniref:Uncharacterized protein LOC118763859 n=1 Tax=Octopus sinensis TaxID=2607531 RepID=A0A7E6EWD9_9MOLL|nr:uncharacterized protein LOC118763859 [Octopus sinensis]